MGDIKGFIGSSWRCKLKCVSTGFVWLGCKGVEDFFGGFFLSIEVVCLMLIYMWMERGEV
jgi:hypothetical protein